MAFDEERSVAFGLEMVRWRGERGRLADGDRDVHVRGAAVGSMGSLTRSQDIDSNNQLHSKLHQPDLWTRIPHLILRLKGTSRHAPT